MTVKILGGIDRKQRPLATLDIASSYKLSFYLRRMLLLFLCVVINAFIGVIFKYFDKYDVNVFQAIVVNYFVCVITGSLVMGDFPIKMSMTAEPWFPYACALSGTFIFTFVIMALTVQNFGIVIATIFQKMSLLAPAIVGIWMYNESHGWIKIAGILLAIASIFVITKRKDTDEEHHSGNWLFPIIVFAGSCLIDTVLYYVNVESIVDTNDPSFVIALFFMAGVIGLTILLYQLISGKSSFSRKSLIAGIGLGIPNFFSIYLLLLVLGQGMDASVVFPINNVGILALSAVFGVILFKEKIGMFKAAGLGLAITAIILVANG